MFEARRLLEPVLAGTVGIALLLAASAETVDLGVVGWLTGAVCGAALLGALTVALYRDRGQRLGPAGWLTLVRATLAVGVATLTVASLAGHDSRAAVVSFSCAALALDYLDGWVARRTDTVSRLGARFDGETDAFLILALSVYVAASAGGWVLLIGAARYVFLLAGWVAPWMRRPLPPRGWRRRVTAVVGVTLTVAAASVLPARLDSAALAVALALIAESFGRDVVWLWRNRSVASDAAGRRRLRLPRSVSVTLTVLAFVLVWVALVAPDQPTRLTPDAFLRLPIEGFAVVALALVVPSRAQRVLAWVVGPVLGVLVFVKVLDVGFYSAFDRPFNPFDDWRYGMDGIETLHASIGETMGNVVLTGAGLLLVLVLAVPTVAVLRMTRVAAGHRSVAMRVVGALAVVWFACWASGAHLVPGTPIASTSAAELAIREVRDVQTGFQDEARFAARIRQDRFASTPGSRLLTALRGKDVLLVFVESYGKVAVQGTSYSPGVDSVLATGSRQLAAAGFGARSGWLTSSTFGGISWLAHSTLQSGLWVNTQSRYDELVANHRLTLTQAFGRAGWRTVADMPSDDRYWPSGKTFYHYDKVYNRLDVGYRGPTYAYASMPDQYTYLALERLELARRDRPPLFAEIDLVSSHEPWTQIPPLIPWGQVGDGSIFYKEPVDTTSVLDTEQAYGRSIRYTLRTLFSFIQHYGQKNLVMIVLGDHQPGHIVSRFGVDHEVPISIIAHDPTVLRRIEGWGWVDGMRPTSAAPVWPMSAFRDRFLTAFSPRSAGTSSRLR